MDSGSTDMDTCERRPEAIRPKWEGAYHLTAPYCPGVTLDADWEWGIENYGVGMHG